MKINDLRTEQKKLNANSATVKSQKMNETTLQIPSSINTKQFNVSVYLATKLYEDGLLSAGQAAEMVKLSKRTFIEILGLYGVSIFSTSVDDLKNDIANA